MTKRGWLKKEDEDSLARMTDLLSKNENRGRPCFKVLLRTLPQTSLARIEKRGRLGKAQ